MTRNLKLLGISISAMLAFGVTAAVASAAEFHSEVAGATLSGEQTAASNDKFTIDAGSVECENATYSGTLSSATTSTASITPSYSGCTAVFGLSVTIDVNGCSYQFHTNPNSMDIVCPSGKTMEITAPGCVVTFFPASGYHSVSFTNTGVPKHAIMHTDVIGTTYEEHNKGFFPTCANNTKLRHNGTVKTTTTAKAVSGGKQVGLWVE